MLDNANSNGALPMVLRSRAALAISRPAVAALPITALGTTYTMAQEVAWVDEQHFAVGRWDGSLSVFNFTNSPTSGPTIARAVNSPAQEGVQMITPLPGLPAFFSSNDEKTILLWRTLDGTWSDTEAVATLRFDETFGVANSGAMLSLGGGGEYFVAGHANGRVTIWRAVSVFEWELVVAVDVRSQHPVNPWGLVNVRGIGVLPERGGLGYVVTGSEDGNLTVIRVPDGEIMSATVYNPAAQRGINSVAVCGTAVLVSNCAVGPKDFNLWAYTVDLESWSLTCTGAVNLAVNPGAAQVFNFDVVCSGAQGAVQFFCSTEEGALWMGALDSAGAPQIAGYETVTAALGSALAWQGANLILAAYDVREFELSE